MGNSHSTIESQSLAYHLFRKIKHYMFYLTSLMLFNKLNNDTHVTYLISLQHHYFHKHFFQLFQKDWNNSYKKISNIIMPKLKFKLKVYIKLLHNMFIIHCYTKHKLWVQIVNKIRFKYLWHITILMSGFKPQPVTSIKFPT